jgi:crotonobetainyl-CoA:carnitine CoA-transferase CaiB-like acyl-CoA transferase
MDEGYALMIDTLHPSIQTGPLHGVHVLDWTHVLSGPYAGFQMAALGADVTRLENPAGADIVRNKAADPDLASQGLGEGYCMLGAGRKCVALDAKDPQAREAIEALVAQSDVLIENFRPGKLAALGLSPGELIKKYPNLIVCSITGYPKGNARAHEPAYDHAIQAASGLMHANADDHGQPQRIGFPVVDYAIGMHAAMAIMAALHRKQSQKLQGITRSQGEWVQLSMLETALALLTPHYAAMAVSGKQVKRTKSTAYSGSALSGTFETAQGFVALVCNTAGQMQNLIATFEQHGANADQAQALLKVAALGDVHQAHQILSQLLAAHDAYFWEQAFAANQVPCSRVRTAYEAFSEIEKPLHIAAGQGDAVRKVSMLSAGFRSNEQLHGQLRDPAPLGMHTKEVLARLGWSEEEIDAALERGAALQHLDLQPEEAP